MNMIDILNIVFVVGIDFAIFRFARAQQQKSQNEQSENE